MAYDVDATNFSTLTAAGDYSSNQYYAVAQTASAATVTLASVAGQKVFGFLQNAPTSGAAADVKYMGIAKARLGGTVAAGDDVVIDATGRCVAAGNLTGYVIGYCVLGGAVGEVGSIMITNRGDRPVQIFPYTVNLATVVDGDIFTGYTPGFRGRVIAVDAVVTQEVTTGSKLSTLNVEIGTVNVTGGAVALTSANTATHGVLVAGSAVTAANTFTATDTISFEAASTTAFSEGQVLLLVKLMQD